MTITPATTPAPTTFPKKDRNGERSPATSVQLDRNGERSPATSVQLDRNGERSPSLAPLSTSPHYRSDGPADRLMRRILSVDGPDRRSTAGAHRAFRVSVMVSAVRCLITYVAIPILVPILSLSGWVAAPVGLALCALAVVNGVVSVRRFWRADHPQRWMYTAFIGVVFVILAIALVSDLSRLGVMT